jgi:hypothetical protein
MVPQSVIDYAQLCLQHRARAFQDGLRVLRSVDLQALRVTIPLLQLVAQLRERSIERRIVHVAW